MKSKTPRRPDDEGAVTAETAIVLPVLLVFLLAGLWAAGVVVAEVRCVDAARDVARAVARGEPSEIAQEIGRRAGPPGAQIAISRDGPAVRVVVRATVDTAGGLLSGLPAIGVEGRATIQVEPGTAGSPP
jgi:Flp pilus assembly protein TadG